MFFLISLIANVFQTYNIYILTTCFLQERRVTKSRELIAYILLFLQLTVPYLMLNIAGLTFICSLTGCLWITLLYTASWRKRLLSGLLVCITMILAESIVAVLAGYVNLEFLETTEYYSIFGTVCAPMVEYMVAKLVSNFKNIKNGEVLPVTYWVISIALPVCSIALYLLFYQQNSWSRWELLGCILFLFLINIFVFFLYDRQVSNFHIAREKEALQLQNEYQNNQLKLLCEMDREVQQQRHDFAKHMSMLFYLNERNEQERIRKYILEIKEEIPLENQYIDTGNSIIDSIINYKIREAEGYGINITTDIKIPSDMEFSAYDMNVLLTNLLDNAIEASQKETEKAIELVICYIHHKLNVHIRNICTKEVKSQYGNFISMKEDRSRHGYGLRIVREMVEKYNGMMKIDVTKGWFDVKIGLIMR